MEKHNFHKFFLALYFFFLGGGGRGGVRGQITASFTCAQNYYFLLVVLGILGAQGHDVIAFCLEFSLDSRSPSLYKQLCQIMKFSSIKHSM